MFLTAYVSFEETDENYVKKWLTESRFWNEKSVAVV